MECDEQPIYYTNNEVIMKVYFYDGELEKATGFAEEQVHFIDAKQGYSAVVSKLEKILKSDGKHAVICSNSLVLLNNDYCWNEETNECSLYVYRNKEGKWFNVQDLTYKEIRFAHNMEKLYKAGQFGFQCDKYVPLKEW